MQSQRVSTRLLTRIASAKTEKPYPITGAYHMSKPFPQPRSRPKPHTVSQDLMVNHALVSNDLRKVNQIVLPAFPQQPIGNDLSDERALEGCECHSIDRNRSRLTRVRQLFAQCTHSRALNGGNTSSHDFPTHRMRGHYWIRGQGAQFGVSWPRLNFPRIVASLIINLPIDELTLTPQGSAHPSSRTLASSIALQTGQQLEPLATLSMAAMSCLARITLASLVVVLFIRSINWALVYLLVPNFNELTGQRSAWPFQ